MIKRDETTLTLEQYHAVMTHQGLFAAQVLIRQRSLEFALHSENQPVAGRLFDAVVYALSSSEEYIAKVYLSNGDLISLRLPTEREGNQSWEVVGTLDTGVAAVRPSIAGEWVFYVKDGAVLRRSHRNPASPAEVVVPADDSRLQANGEITHLAAADDGLMCFVACYRSDYNTVLIGAKYTGTPWTTFVSDVYWPHKLDGMDAANVGDSLSGEYVLVIATDLPPLIGQQAEGTKVYRVAERRSGLIAFRIQNRRFSDHFLVEVFDDASDTQCRTEPRLTRLYAEGQYRVVLTAFGKDGKATYHHAALHYYFTRDGRLWETDQLINLPNVYNGAVMVVMPPYTYLVAETKTYRSPSTELTGQVHPDLVEDITSLVLGYNSDQSSARQSTLQLKNTGWWETSLLSKKVQLSMLTQLGVWLDGQKVLVPIANELIDVITPSREKPAEQITLKASDYMSLISNVVRSPHSREYDTQALGADKYYDFTGTGYGGLAHTAGAEGTWSTADNWLRLRSNNKRGIAFNTFKSDGLWNGLIEAAIRIDTPEKTPETPTDEEFVGLVVRAYDKNNLLAIEYEVDGDELRLVKLVDGKSTRLHRAKSMGWGYDETHYLRVMFRYSKIRVFVSDDGKSWTQKFEYLLPGKEPASATPTSGNAKVTYEEGLVGFTGLGYGDDDTWDDGGDTTTPPGEEENVYGTGTKSGLVALTVQETGGPMNRARFGMVAYTRACTTGPWNLLHGGIQTLSNGRPQEMVGCFLDPFDPGAAYLFFKNGDCYYNPDWRSGADWELFASAADLQSAFNAAHGCGYSYINNAVVTMAAEGYCLLTAKLINSSYAGIGAEGTGVLIRVRRLQNGIDVSPAMKLTLGNYTDSGLRNPFAHLGTRNANLVMATGTGYWQKEYSGVWVCNWTTTGHDWSCFSTHSYGGHTFWSPKFQTPHTSGQCHVVWSPWKKLDGSDNTDDQQMFWAGPNDQIWKSETGGASFSPWTGAGVCPSAVGKGPWLDTWEVNIDNAAWVDYIRGSGDKSTPDKLYLSDDAGEKWKSVMLPIKYQVGWSGGFPSRSGQFYIGASRWGDGLATQEESGRGSLLLFTQNGGETWTDWTWNLWSLIHSLDSFSHLGAGVVRFTPHWLET